MSRNLLHWYDQNRRELPWRTAPSLYGTVVSEFMLQQTQVKTVLPYFDKWLQDFPSFESLANASEEKVVRNWEGLGYYRRARNLHKVANLWVESSEKPKTYDAWLQYPGIGPYMAAAISSIDFHEPVVVVDGNVVRVIARLRGFGNAFKNSLQASNFVRSHAQCILSHQRPGDFNQALMELGATVCRPQSPQCLLCPWNSSCKARKQGLTDSIPNIQKIKTVKITRPRLFAVDMKSKKILLAKGEMKGRLNGIYELPMMVKEAKPELKKIATIKRGISNELITEPVYQCTGEDYSLYGHKKTEPEWIPFKSLNEVSLSGPHRKWLSDFLSSDEDSC